MIFGVALGVACSAADVRPEHAGGDESYGYANEDDPLAYSDDAGLECHGCMPPNVCVISGIDTTVGVASPELRAYCSSPEGKLCSAETDACP